MKNLIIAISMLVPVSTAFAGASGLGIGVHGGVVSGYDNPVLEDSILSDFPGFELTNNMYDIGAHLNVGTFRVIEFDVNLDYAWKKQEVAPDINLTFSDFSISASVRKSLPLGPIKPYAGAGLGLHVIAYSLDVGGQVVGVVLPDDESKSGFLLKAGLELNIPLFPLTPYGEYRYNIIQTTGESTKYSSILFGITLDLP